MNNVSKKQLGGTAVGLIVGAVLGLGAALAVAVYVTKVPIPFLNKTQARSAENDAAETKKNKDWDPNAALAGKSALKPAPVSPTVVGTVITPSPEAVPTVVTKARPSNDPLGDLAKARMESKPDAKPQVKMEPKPEVRAEAKPDAASSIAGVDPFSYFIQAGAFRTPEDAEQQRAKLTLMGFQAKVTEREQSGRTVYRVRLGPFDKKDEADRTKEKLEGNSVETAMVRVQR